jgi:ubiquinone/menaquinone biosynthesis C-methylase UbiE
LSERRQLNLLEAERERVQSEYLRRELEVDAERYAPWQPAEMFWRHGRERAAATMLRRAGVFPRAGVRCLEVGYGTLGWLGHLISWGVRERDIHGVELSATRAERAQELLPVADLRVGDATAMHWEDGRFQLVIASTVFTSILDGEVRKLLAGEICRVLAPGGALLWYDFAVDNPRNPNVRKVGRQELNRLFQCLRGEVKSVTLAPPIARLVTPRSWALASVLDAIPCLRTHLLAILLKA